MGKRLVFDHIIDLRFHMYQLLIANLKQLYIEDPEFLNCKKWYTPYNIFSLELFNTRKAETIEHI